MVLCAQCKQQVLINAASITETVTYDETAESKHLKFCTVGCKIRYNQENRSGTGRTTLIALQTFACCYHRPDEWIPIKDHFGTRGADAFLARYMQQLAERMNLKFDFTKTGIGDYFIRLGKF